MKRDTGVFIEDILPFKKQLEQVLKDIDSQN